MNIKSVECVNDISKSLTIRGSSGINSNCSNGLEMRSMIRSEIPLLFLRVYLKKLLKQAIL